MILKKIFLICLRRKTHQRDCPRDVPCDVASVFPTHYLIIATTYQRDNVRERHRQLDHFQNCYIFTAPVVGLIGTCRFERRVGRRFDVWTCGHGIFASVVASFVACLIAFALYLVCFALYHVYAWVESKYILKPYHISGFVRSPSRQTPLTRAWADFVWAGENVPSRFTPLSLVWSGEKCPIWDLHVNCVHFFQSFCFYEWYPANTKHLYGIGTTSAQGLRRWYHIVQMFYKCFVFTGWDTHERVVWTLEADQMFQCVCLVTVRETIIFQWHGVLYNWVIILCLLRRLLWSVDTW